MELVSPVGEKMFKRLYALYSRMVTELQHYAGLNPRGFRQARVFPKPVISSIGTGLPGPRSILDGDLLWRFIQLPVSKQYQLASAIGSNRDLILDDLLEIVSGMEHF